MPCSPSELSVGDGISHMCAGAVITSPSRWTAQTQLSHELCLAESKGSAMQFETRIAIKAGRRIINVVCEWIDEDDPGGEVSSQEQEARRFVNRMMAASPVKDMRK